ncbi:fibronectin type III-like domain-contianing protein [Streptomyces lateritius]|uniref:Fibronectin type III-like domain-contianing protein n=1 Tax=Streptomyces lateritius TaxID=67313 RepID=A0ABW6YM70_9ACTN
MTLTVDGLTLLEGVFLRETDDPAVVHVNPPVREARAVLTSKRPVHVVARRELVPGFAAGDAFTMRVRLRNTGTRAGREVVQVYMARPGSSVERPLRWFVGYAAVRAEAGRAVIADVEVPARALRHWSEEERAWSTEPGPYRLMVGRSAGDRRWEGALTVERRAVTG